jgi:hypothetical protein
MFQLINLIMTYYANFYSFFKVNIFSLSSKNMSDILFSAFKNAFVMKRFVYFTDIFIYKQFSCHGYMGNHFFFVTNIDTINNV